MVALEAYRQLALPGSPGPAALGRVADVRMETASRVLAELKLASTDVVENRRGTECAGAV